jgi:hypothetical protein
LGRDWKQPRECSNILFYVINCCEVIEREGHGLYSMWSLQWNRNMHACSCVRCLLFLSDSNQTYILSADFTKTIKLLQESVQCEPTCFMRGDAHDETKRYISNFLRKYLKSYVYKLTTPPSIKQEKGRRTFLVMSRSECQISGSGSGSGC